MIKEAELLENAADILEANGWVRGVLHQSQDGGHAYCAFGALNMASHGNHYYFNSDEHHTLVIRAGGEVERVMGLEDLVTWNNRDAKDKYEVIEAFRLTAKELRNEGRG